MQGVGELKDGFRFVGKGCNLLKNKCIGATIVGGNPGISQQFHVMVGIAKQVSSGNASVANGFKLVNSLGGFENYSVSCFSQMGSVNVILQNGAQAGMGNVVPALSGAVGSSVFKNPPNS